MNRIIPPVEKAEETAAPELAKKGPALQEEVAEYFKVQHPFEIERDYLLEYNQFGKFKMTELTLERALILETINFPGLKRIKGVKPKSDTI